MNLRTATACVILFCIGLIIAWPLLPSDGPTPPPPIEVIEPPTPIIDQVPGTPGLPPAPPPPDANRISGLVTPSPDGPQPSDGGAAGNPCIGGNCPTQPQAGSGVQYRRFQWRRR